MSDAQPRIRSTTILAVRRNGKVALGGDGQVTVGQTVMKSNAQKVRLLKGGKVLAGHRPCGNRSDQAKREEPA